MQHLKKILGGGFIGIGVGFTLNLIFSVLYGQYVPGVPSYLAQYDSLLVAVLFETLIYMGLGIIQVYAYDFMRGQRINLLPSTILHFTLILLPHLAAAYLLHWSRDVLSFLSLISTFSIVYFGIWIVYYLHIKNQVDQINKKIAHNIKMKDKNAEP